MVLLNNIIDVLAVRSMAHGPIETDEAFDARYIAYFQRSDIDGWELRKVSRIFRPENLGDWASKKLES